MEHLRKAHLGFGCGFRFLLCKKSGILLISEPGLSLTQGSSRLTRLRGGVTLGAEQGEAGANFYHLSKKLQSFANDGIRCAVLHLLAFA